jgi:hypothetical protein
VQGVSERHSRQPEDKMNREPFTDEASAPTNAEESQFISVAGLKANGWTDKAIDLFLGVEDEQADNPHYSRAAPMRLYDKQRVLAAQNSLRFQVWKVEHLYRQHAKAKSTVSTTERRYAQFANIYESWRDALPTACEILFNLNHYAKHESCSSQHREEIYSLKNEFIRLLYEQGLSTECWRHTVKTEPRLCFCDRKDEDCERCYGTGIYQKILHYVCFTFVVDGKKYHWHQPSYLVNYRFTVTTENKTWERNDFEKPITLAANKFAEAKDLLRWILAQARPEQETATTVTSQASAESGNYCATA